MPARDVVSHFATPLQTELVDEFEGIDKLLARLGYWSDLLGCEVDVPQDFHTDYASVPRLPLAYLMFGGKGKRAAVVHDALYSGLKLPSGRTVTRLEADQVFREALAATGYSKFTQDVMYTAVRLGGERRYIAPNVQQPDHVAAVMDPVDFEAP